MALRKGILGRTFSDGELICAQGEAGDCMYVIQHGKVVVTRSDDGREIEIGELGRGDIFGEMSIFDKRPRSATVRARGPATILTLDKRAFLRRVHEDPSLAFRLMKKMSERIRDQHARIDELARRLGAADD